MADDVEIAQVLLEHGADLRRQDRYGETPLHYAASRGRIDVARLLIKHGADVNARFRILPDGGSDVLWRSNDTVGFGLIHRHLHLRARLGDAVIEILDAVDLLDLRREFFHLVRDINTRRELHEIQVARQAARLE